MTLILNKLNHNMDITLRIFEARNSKDCWKATAAKICITCAPVIFLIASAEMIFKNGLIFAMNCVISTINEISSRVSGYLNPPYEEISPIFPEEEERKYVEFGDR